MEEDIIYFHVPQEFKEWKFNSVWGEVAHSLGAEWPMHLKCAALLAILGWNLMIAGALANERMAGQYEGRNGTSKEETGKGD